MLIVNKVSAEDVANQAVETLRATMNAQFRIATNEHPQRLLSLEEVAGIVEDVLKQVHQALMEALEDGASERERWWREPERGPYDLFKGGLTDQGYLPRTLPGSSWWTGDPENPSLEPDPILEAHALDPAERLRGDLEVIF